MQNELAIDKFGFNNRNCNENKAVNKLKIIGQDSLFYFGVFLFAFFILQYIPFISGIFDDYSIGVNEVVVSLIGFANVFFLKVYNKLFRKAL